MYFIEILTDDEKDIDFEIATEITKKIVDAMEKNNLHKSINVLLGITELPTFKAFKFRYMQNEYIAKIKIDGFISPPGAKLKMFSVFAEKTDNPLNRD